MADNNPLVDPNSQFNIQNYAGPNPVSKGPDDDWLSGTGLWDDCYNYGKDLSTGDWGKAAIDAASTVVDTIGTVMNPIATLVSMGCGWMLDHIKPLELIMDEVCGNPATVTGVANTWKNISTALDQTRTSYQQSVGKDTTSWSGQAADAYRGHTASTIITALGGTSALSMAMSDVMTVGSNMVSAVHDAVRDIISAVVGQLVQDAIEEACTLGLGTPAVVAQVAGTVAEYVPKAKSLVDVLVDTMKDGGMIATRIISLINSILSTVRTLAANNNVALPGPSGVLSAPAGA